MGLKPLSRSVSIIGVGSTKFGSPYDTPELKDLAFQELGAWAVLSALKDAGVNPREVDHLVVGSISSPTHNAHNVSPQHGFLEWVGMKGKSSNYQCAGCATGFNCINQAVDMVAGGRCDIVVAVVMEISHTIVHPDKPSHIRYPYSEYEKHYNFKCKAGPNGLDTAYQRWVGANFCAMDSCGRHYMRDNGVTFEEMEDAQIGAAITSRHHGALVPEAYGKTHFEDAAKDHGFDSAEAFLKSNMNPLITDMIRIAFCGVLAEGAAALVFCATDIAKKFQQKPIEVVNISQCDYSPFTPNNEQRMTRRASEALYNTTGFKPEEIEYLATTNMDNLDLIDSAEAVGYLPKGESWKYFRDGDTRFDKAKPINTDGGTQGIGHAFAATALHNYGEAVLQMRGQADKRQITPPPKVSMVRGQGATHSVSIGILRTVE